MAREFEYQVYWSVNKMSIEYPIHGDDYVVTDAPPLNFAKHGLTATGVEELVHVLLHHENQPFEITIRNKERFDAATFGDI